MATRLDPHDSYSRACGSVYAPLHVEEDVYHGQCQTDYGDLYRDVASGVRGKSRTRSRVGRRPCRALRRRRDSRHPVHRVGVLVQLVHGRPTLCRARAGCPCRRLHPVPVPRRARSAGCHRARSVRGLRLPKRVQHEHHRGGARRALAGARDGRPHGQRERRPAR